MYPKQVFCYLDDIWTFIASSFMVTEENVVFETVQSVPYSSFESFSTLKGAHFIFY